jgi:CHAT domain-containing protein/tetratricopeptide (TPR) repeat protein
MSLGPDDARRLADLDPESAFAKLTALDLLDAEGLGAILDQAGALIRDDPQIGVRLAQLVRAHAEQAEAPLATPRATYLMAQANAAAGEMGAALTLIEEARAEFERLERRTEALRTNLGRAQVLNEVGRHAEALASCQEILDDPELNAEVSSSAIVDLLAAAHQNSGLCLELTGQFESALDHYASAGLGYASIGATRAMAEVAYDRGLVLLALGQHANALAALTLASATFREGGFRALLAMALTNTAEVHLYRGEYQSCLDALREANEALADISSPMGDHVRLLTAARAYSALHLWPEARASFTEALAFLGQRDLAIERARAQWGLGVVLAAMGSHTSAETALADAADQFTRSGQSAWRAGVLLDQALLQRAMGNEASAAMYAEEAVVEAPKDSPADLETRLLIADLSNGDQTTEYRAIAGDADRLALVPVSAAAHHALGRQLASAGLYRQAEISLRTALARTEELRGGLRHETSLTHFFDDSKTPYGDLVDVLVTSGGPASAALMVGEQAKSRTLSDIVRGLVARSQPEMSSETDSLDEDRRAIYGELFSGSVPSGSDRSEVLRRRLRELETRRRLIDLEAGGPAPQTSEPSVVADVAPPEGTATISFVRSGDLLHVFVVDITTVHRAPRPVSGVQLAELVDRLRRQWDKFRLGDDLLERHLPQLHRATNAVLHDMYDLIVAPIESLIRRSGTDHLIFVPDGVAHDVPFAALFDGAHHLIEHYTISIAPSILTLSHLPPRRSGPALVVGVADELAPLVEEEARAVAELLPSSQLLCGSEATWDALRGAVIGVQHLHLAGHTVFRPDNPMFSAIKLADTWVTAADLLTTSLDGATVVLSSCDSARTQSRGSAEINGFVRSFLGAGAATVLASQWSADDTATRALMESFYRNLANDNPAGALRSAQLALAERWPHPYYWAPWVLTGRHAG